MSDELLDLHRELQAALSRYGVTRYTMDLQFRLERLLAKEQGVNLADAKQLDAALDVPHRRAFDAKSRPQRLTPFEPVLEDYTR
jgi:hypothetical protein